jgi:hypothetical protein
LKGVAKVESNRRRAIIFCNEGDWRFQGLKSGLLKGGFAVHTVHLQRLLLTLEKSIMPRFYVKS